MMNLKQRDLFMKEALKQAEKAFKADEVPVGAIVVYKNKIIAKAHNKTIKLNDPSAHAEILAIRKASKFLGNYRLKGATLYVTLEPCPMCYGALVWARIETLVYGAKDLKAGACGSKIDLTKIKFNHKIKVEGNVLGEESSKLLKRFFKNKR